MPDGQDLYLLKMLIYNVINVVRRIEKSATWTITEYMAFLWERAEFPDFF